MLRFLAGTPAFCLSLPQSLAQSPLERGAYLVNTVMTCHNCHTPMGPNGPQFDRGLSGGLASTSPPSTSPREHHARP